MASRKPISSSGFKVEFFSDVSGKPRRARARHYSTGEGMLRAGARWELKGSDYHCRYWNGLNTWVSATRQKAAEPLPHDTSCDCPKCAPQPPRARRHGRSPQMKIFSVFGQCEAVAAEVMLKDGRILRKIPVEEIPKEALFNQFGDKARFAVLVPGPHVQAFDELCKDIRA